MNLQHFLGMRYLIQDDSSLIKKKTKQKEI